MTKTVFLTIAGFANERIFLSKPDGKQIAITLDQFQGDDLNAIRALMDSGIKNWNDTDRAPIDVVADVEIDENGTYRSLSIRGFHIDNG
jgi:hypothetical protein